MTGKDFKAKIKTFSNEELLKQLDFIADGYFTELVEVCFEELKCRLEATKWHYPSKGEFPPSGEEVLIRIDKKNYLGTYDGEVMWDIPLAEITCSGDWVDMWQYIILPPKEEA